MATKNYTIDEDLHLKFKIKCVEDKTDMSKEIRTFIEGFVNEGTAPLDTGAEMETGTETSKNNQSF